MPVKKIKSLKDIEKFSAQLQAEQNKFKARVLICMTGCRALGAKDVAEKFKEGLKLWFVEDVENSKI